MTDQAYDWIAHHANTRPSKLAILDLYSGRRFTYAEVHNRVARLAGFFQDSLSVNHGDRVAVLSQNTSDIFEIQFACARLGAIFQPLNFRLTIPELAFIVSDAAPVVLIVDIDFAEVGWELARRCGISHTINLRGDGGDSGYEQGIADARPITSMTEQTLDDVCAIMYTSGTTGRPKGATITHGMAFYNAANTLVPARIGSDSVQLVFLPLFHIAALNAFANPVFYAAGTAIIMRTFTPCDALNAMNDAALGITHMTAVPVMYQSMAQADEFKTTDFSRIRMPLVGAAPVPLQILNTWRKRGVEIQQGYGMTETAGAVLLVDKAETLRKIGTAGTPFLHTDMRVVDTHGEDVAAGKRGELWIKGPIVTPGYWNRPDANEKDFTDGWLHTGDAVVRDDDGYYTIVDRQKDMYISGGENVYPAEVEDVLYQLEEISEVAVIGVPDEKWGEVGYAVVVLKTDAELSPKQLLDHCQGKLAPYKHPHHVLFAGELPRSATGKLQKHILREQLSGKEVILKDSSILPVPPLGRADSDRPQGTQRT